MSARCRCLAYCRHLVLGWSSSTDGLTPPCTSDGPTSSPCPTIPCPPRPADGTVKLSDFGLGVLPNPGGSEDLLRTTCGTPNYVAPEVLAKKGYRGGPADVWSLGEPCQWGVAGV